MAGNREHTVWNKGDWVEEHGLPGLPSRRGQITEVIGAPPHTRYRVRWDEQHESICYPADGVVLLPRGAVLGDGAEPKPARISGRSRPAARTASRGSGTTR